MTIRIVPKDTESLIDLATQCHAGVLALAVELNLKQNDPLAFALDLYDLVGEPGADPETAGRQGALNISRRVFLAAQTARRLAFDAGRAFNARAVDHLKGYFGRRWNPLWQTAGFTGGSLIQPYQPLTRMLEFRAYFAANPAHESAGLNLTAAEANRLIVNLGAARDAEAAADIARSDAARDRDEAAARLRTRVVGLRAELDQLMDSDDLRWRRFGFARPIDRRIPKPVPQLSLRAVGAGEIIVEWQAATGAETYRVTRQVTNVDPDPVEVGLFTDRLAIIRGLPVGSTVIVAITARNPAGETLAISRTIDVA